jgi:hypothetical protein
MNMGFRSGSAVFSNAATDAVPITINIYRYFELTYPVGCCLVGPNEDLRGLRHFTAGGLPSSCTTPPVGVIPYGDRTEFVHLAKFDLTSDLFLEGEY